MNLIIGSAQFGMNYGISNTTGITPALEIKKILDFCYRNKIYDLDTANTYGSAEENLGAHHLENFNVSSKIKYDPNIHLSYDDFKDDVKKTLQNLSIQKLHTLFLHNPFEIKEDLMNKCKNYFIKAKDEGLIKNIGFSLYHPSDINLDSEDWFDVIQIPFNLFDTTLLTSGLMNELKERKKNIEVRSIFLQGLLLSSLDKLPMAFKGFSNDFIELDSFCKENKLSRLEASIYFIKSFKDIDRVVIGVESLTQLDQVVKIFNNKTHHGYDFRKLLRKRHCDLIDPRRWND